MDQDQQHVMDRVHDVAVQPFPADGRLQALIDAALPVLRAEFGLPVGRRYQSDAPLALALTVLAGREDSHVPPAYLADWQGEIAADFRLCPFPGDPFFIHAQPETTTHLITAALLGGRAAAP